MSSLNFTICSGVALASYSTLCVESLIARISKRLRSRVIDSEESITAAYVAWRNRSLESIPWNRFLGSLNVYKFALRC
jgi:hypothetical protein